MASIEETKLYTQVSVDPNLPLPPGVIDLGYKNIDDDPSGVERSATTGEVVSTEYSEVSAEEFYQDLIAANSLLLPPNTVTVVSQVARGTSDGTFVVDVVLDVPDAQGVTGYDVRVTKT